MYSQKHSRGPPQTSPARPPRILYSGTTFSYARNRWHQWREFRHAGVPVCLAESYSLAQAYAHKRAETYEDSPIILLVNPSYLTHALRKSDFARVYEVDSLNAGSFVTIPPTYPESLSGRAWKFVEVMRAFAEGMPPSSLEDLVEKQLGRYRSDRIPMGEGYPISSSSA